MPYEKASRVYFGNCFSVAVFGPPTLFCLSQRALYPDWLHRFAYFPVLAMLGVGLTWSNSLAVLEAIKQSLGVNPGQTTRDGLFSLEVVACIGACGLAPVITVNGEFYAGVSPKKVRDIVETYREEAGSDE